MKKAKVLKTVGWREWLSLPDLGIKRIKAKVDTGARTSSLHAFDIEYYQRGKSEFVKFTIHPEQKTSKNEKVCRAKVLEFRKVKSSNGQTEVRPVILTTVKVLDEVFEIEITLTNRDEMGFRMLLGRESLRKRFLVDAGKSYYSKELKK